MVAEGAAAVNSGSAASGKPATEANGLGTEAAAGETVEVVEGTVGGTQHKKDGKPRVLLTDPTTLEQLEAVRPGCCVAILRCVLQIHVRGRQNDQGWVCDPMTVHAARQAQRNCRE